jgi:hypothetical protein
MHEYMKKALTAALPVVSTAFVPPVERRRLPGSILRPSAWL